ncbi:MAG: DUF2066 domain-containing protein [Pseudomonadota bacterium]
MATYKDRCFDAAIGWPLRHSTVLQPVARPKSGMRGVLHAAQLPRNAIGCLPFGELAMLSVSSPAASRSRRCAASATLVLSGLAAAGVAAVPASAEPRVFTVANYPVEAIARNAVAAKRQAIAEGQAAALRSLLKRLVPVTRYAQLRQVKLPDASGLVDSVQVRSERNSSTEYVAELDLTFQPTAVRRLLQEQGLPFVEKAAPLTTLIPIYKQPLTPPGQAAALDAKFRKEAGAKTWFDVWKGLDLANALTPVTLATLGPRIHPDTLAMVTSGDGGGQRILQGEYGTQRVVVAEIEPDLPTRRLKLVLVGSDAVGPFRLVRALRFEPEDFAYGLEFVAVIAQGVLEGRWKAIQEARAERPASVAAYAPRDAEEAAASGITRAGDGNRRAAVPRSYSGQQRWPSTGTGTGAATSDGTQQSATVASRGQVAVTVRFLSLAQWQQMRRVIEGVSGVRQMDIQGLSPRSANVVVDYPRGGSALADALARRGLRMVQVRDRWVLR